MVSRYAYDANGNQTNFTDALGRSTTNVFDALNRRIAFLYPDGSRQTTTYDSLGRRVSETDQATPTWQTDFLFDARPNFQPPSRASPGTPVA